MKIIGSRRVEVEVDPLDALINIEREWLSKAVQSSEAYIKDGLWYADDRYGPDQLREATQEEKEIHDAFVLLISYMRKTKTHGTEAVSR